MFGVTDSAWRANGAYSVGLNEFHSEKLADNLAELHMVLPPILMNVVDAVRVIVQGGPARSAEALTVASPGRVLAGKDIVARLGRPQVPRQAAGRVVQHARDGLHRRVRLGEPADRRAVHHGLGRINLDRDGLHLARPGQFPTRAPLRNRSRSGRPPPPLRPRARREAPYADTYPGEHRLTTGFLACDKDGH